MPTKEMKKLSDIIDNRNATNTQMKRLDDIFDNRNTSNVEMKNLRDIFDNRNTTKTGGSVSGVMNGANQVALQNNPSQTTMNPAIKNQMKTGNLMHDSSITLPYLNSTPVNRKDNENSGATGVISGATGAINQGAQRPTVTQNAGTGNYASFTPSDSYAKAMEYTNSLLAELSSGRTSYTDQINNLMSEISGREAFSYDMNTDTMFQNYLASMMQSGKSAMADTMGQASALTGGYGSTYATAAANGAYNQYIQDAYANLPDYYSMALDKYNMEGQNLYNQLEMYSVADENEYNRLANAYSMNLQNAANMYDQEYNNYWQTQNHNEAVRQYDEDMAYKYASLAQDQAQYEANLAYDLANSLGSSSKSGSSNITDSQRQGYLEEALKAYNTGGVEALEQYEATLPDNEQLIYDVEDYIAEFGKLPEEKRTYTKTDDTINWFWGSDDDDEVTDQYGNKYKLSDLEKFLSKEEIKKLTKLKEGQSNK